MFDLFPDVGERMLDVEPMDAAGRDLVEARRTSSGVVRPGLGLGRFAQLRHVLGVRLIALGSALTADELARPRSAAR